MQTWLWSGATTLGLALVSSWVASPAVAVNEFVELRSGNSIYRTNIFTFGIDQSSWWVDGVDHQFSDQYFLNFGTDQTQRALELKDLTLKSLVQPTENRFLAEFSTFGANLNFSLDSSLLGFDPGSRRSYREEVVTIANTGPDAINITLFSYIDFDMRDFDLPLERSFDNDTTAFIGNTLIQTDPSGSKATVSMDQPPTTAQIAEYPFLISQLKNELRPDLANSPTPIISGDGSAAFQFDRRLQPGSSLSFRFVKQIEQRPDTAPVPEPTILLSLGVVAGALCLRRRP